MNQSSEPNRKDRHVAVFCIDYVCKGLNIDVAFPLNRAIGHEAMASNFVLANLLEDKLDAVASLVVIKVVPLTDAVA